MNHRSLIKILLNPFLRLIGLQIATEYDIKKNKLLKATMTTCRVRWTFGRYGMNKNWTVKKERRII